MTGQKTRTHTNPTQRPVMVRVVAVTGLLLALNLLVLPWHHFTLDLGPFGVDSGETLTLDRTAIRAPNGLLGIVALVLAVAMVAYAAVESLAGDRMSSASGSAAGLVPLVAGPAALVVLLGKLALEPEFLGIGAWAGVLLGAALAVGGVALGRQAVAAQTRRGVSPHWQSRGGGRTLTQQQMRWMCLIGVVVVSTVLIVWQGDKAEEITAPFIQDPSLDVNTATPESTLAVEGTVEEGAEPAEDPSATADPDATDTTDPGAAGSLPAAGDRVTVVRPSVAETGDSVTVTASGLTPGKSFVIKLARDGSACGTSATRLGAPRVAADDGSLGPAQAVIPLNTSAGRYFVCFADLADPSNSTEPAQLVVV